MRILLLSSFIFIFTFQGFSDESHNHHDQFDLKIGDKINILRVPLHIDHQHMQPSLNPWTVISNINSDGYIQIRSGNVLGSVIPEWGDCNPLAENPFFSCTPIEATQESSFYLNVNGNGYFDPPNIYVGDPTDSSTVITDDDGHVIITPNTGDDNNPNTGTTNNNQNDYNGTLTNVIPVYTDLIDQDNDVPTLLSIRSKLHTLQQELIYQEEKTRGTTDVIVSNTVTNKEVSLADIYEALNNDSEKQEIQEAQSELESQESNAISDLEDTANSFKDKVENFANLSVTQAPNKQAGFTNLALNAGSYNFYLDPFNDNIMGESLLGVTWKDIADWISLIIGLVVVVWYWRAVLNMSKDVANTMIIANPTAPVTSLTIFGNSVGTVVMKIIKVGIMVTVIAGVLGNTALVLLESDFNMLGNEGTAPNIINALTNDIAGYDTTWTAFTVGLFFDFVPILSITSMIVSYYSQRTIMWILMMIGYLSCKIST
jgi:hypothetical protein